MPAKGSAVAGAGACFIVAAVSSVKNAAATTDI